MNKVLIVSYYWPPSGGAGVQRWLKFSKYLPDFGWEPVILTVDPADATYPATDYSLITDLPSSLKVHTTSATNYFSIYKKDKSKIPSAGFANNTDNTFKGKLLRFVRGNFFIPDPRRGWNRYAFKKACELIEAEDIKHIITTSPPHSSQLIGLKIKKKYPEIRWVADLRDPWTDIYYYKQFYPTLVSKSIDLRFEKEVLKKADRIITVGNSLKTLFSSKLDGIEKKIEVITNGYDTSDFLETRNIHPPRFTVTYVGTLSDIYPVEGFLNALENFKEKGNDFILRFIGTVSPEQKEIIRLKTGDAFLEFIPYVDHSEAIKFMLGTTALLLIIPDHQSNRSIITGKLFEYIASMKPIICVGPVDGDAALIVKESGHGMTFLYNDVHEMSAYLETLISNSSFTEMVSSEIFSRRELTRKIIPLLTS
jgi:glycosyltransferase involved in cell wall biosynthesis